MFKHIGLLAFFLWGATLAAQEEGLPLRERDDGEEVVQKITFVEDDAQFEMTTRIFTLKHIRSADLAPFIKSAVIRFDPVSTVTRLSGPRGEEKLMVTTAKDMIPYVIELVETLDRPAENGAAHNAISGTGIAYGNYTPRYRAAEEMKKIIVEGEVASGSEDGKVKYDHAGNYFYFKDAPERVREIKEKLTFLDRPIPQCRLMFTIHEVRDQDLLDIGIDYLAWKNGPGLNLFSGGYEALAYEAMEYIFDELSQQTLALSSSLSYSYGAVAVAPAFDMSFIRLLEQSGKSKAKTQASLTVNNAPGYTFSTAVSPSYQKLMKDENFRMSVSEGAPTFFYCDVDEVVLSTPECDTGCVYFKCKLHSGSVIERNNRGDEITEETCCETFAGVKNGSEKILCSWSRSADVEQTIGVPYLCELPVLKYIFGTTTQSTETFHYFVSVRAEWIHFDDSESVTPGELSEFEPQLKKLTHKE